MTMKLRWRPTMMTISNMNEVEEIILAEEEVIDAEEVDIDADAAEVEEVDVEITEAEEEKVIIPYNYN